MRAHGWRGSLALASAPTIFEARGKLSTEIFFFGSLLVLLGAAAAVTAMIAIARRRDRY
jgi:hypothetical protein